MSQDRPPNQPFFWPSPAPAAGEDGQGAGALTVYLGVFILLLGFFILLNAISHFHDQKVGAVLRSVDQAFSMPRLLSGDSGEKVHDHAMGDALQAMSSLGDLVRSEVALARVETSADGLALTATMPADALFGSGGGVRTDRVALLDRLAGALVPRPGGVQVAGEMLMGIKGQGETGPAVARMGALARALVANGAPAAALSIGLEPDDPAGQVRLVFRLPPPKAVASDGGGR
ncbi:MULTISPECIES: hypothetical protein [unclassified Azospirillum]|uniref:hypothetical protein n=1 Tax=unclassified Azospirillum TaxID=2630922 RepID=UPI000B6885A0|nr:MULTISPECIES: hypothetical protein [unclassified Azospirillum]SNS39117.1 hypothetical protein SAMN05880556_104214 [Azospirillum sp. RU38E]SNS57504.1 hypothetical protein SAMN05880591_104214 [Azospirillum sp. RU37A]